MAPQRHEPAPSTDPRRRIVDFRVYDLPGGGWRAVHRADPSIVHEGTDWDRLFRECLASRCAYSLRQGFAQMEAERGDGS